MKMSAILLHITVHMYCSSTAATCSKSIKTAAAAAHLLLVVHDDRSLFKQFMGMGGWMVEAVGRQSWPGGNCVPWLQDLKFKRCFKNIMSNSHE